MEKENSADFFSGICDLKAMVRSATSVFSSGSCGELFLEYAESEILRIENGIVQTPDINFRQGFGLRTFRDDSSRYSHSSSLDEFSIKKAADVVNFSSMTSGGGCNCSCSVDQVEPSADAANSADSSDAPRLYESARFIDSVTLHKKIDCLKRIDACARSKSPLVQQVIATITASWQVIYIATDEGKIVQDIRPLTRLSVSVILRRGDVSESGMCSGGGRFAYESILNDSTVHFYVDEALRQANVKLDAIRAPAGEMPVILANGWTGIMLHESIGHGLEGDFIRKKTSSFHNLLGEMIAAPNISVVDDGTMSQRRGSIRFDDEGNKSQRTMLIENGKLVGFLWDRMNAAIMSTSSTGNGRRESYKHMPIPRMTNTFMLAGNCSSEEMIGSVKKGLFAKTFSSGQVDVVSGKFVFSSEEAYLIENGKITTPVNGAMLIGDGPSILKKISLVGNDLALDPGVGTCGKNGQYVPVGVGEPSVLIDKITVGGAEL
jgi:TldD protein